MGAENVSKANSAAVCACGSRAKDGKLGQALGCAHNASRLRGFVRGNEQELRYVVFGGETREIPGDQRVVANRREWIRFHERNMLERGGVINSRRLIFFEQRRKKLAISSVAKERKKRRCRGTGGKRSFDFVEILFGVIEQDEQIGRLPCDGVDESRANAATRAGDENGFSAVNDGKRFGNRREISRGQKLVPVEGGRP